MAKKQFKAESKRLLELMINSIYTNKEIFLRELISNASDALDKRHYISLTDKDAKVDKKDLKITIERHPDTHQLIIEDTGIGMTSEELEKNLGTIAKSGSAEFREQFEKAKKNTDIIGQFGVGFYSAFMVAKRILVETKSIKSDKAYSWSSSGEDGYVISEIEKSGYGTRITLDLKEDTEDEKYSEFLEEWKIKELIKKYSDYVRYPIEMECTKHIPDPTDDKKTIETQEVETLNSMVPLWKRNKNELTKEDYNAFYKDNFYDYEDPLKYIHINVEGAVSYKALLYIPAKAPYDYYSKNYEKGLKLYTDGVLITDKCADLLPDYFSFVKGLVDSELQLNISRETIQHNRQLQLIESNIEKKIKNELLDMQKNDRETYDKFYKAFGLQLKYGLYSGWGMNKEVLQDLIMFKSVKLGKYVTLKEYVDAFGADQKYIYYGSAKTEDAVKALPQSEKLLDSGYDILCFTDDVDEFAVKMLGKYEEKEFKNILDESLANSAEDDKKNEEDKDMLEAIKSTLGDKVSKVKVSSVLKSHPVCLSSEGEVSIEMEKVLSQMPNAEPGMIKANKILEINCEHPVYAKLKSVYENDKDEIGAYADVLYQMARLAAGLPVEDASALNDKLFALLAK